MKKNKEEILNIIARAIREEEVVGTATENIKSVLKWLDCKESEKELIEKKMNKINRESRGHIEILNYIGPKVERGEADV